MPETAPPATRYLQNLWNLVDAAALAADPLGLLKYRSNLLGADLRITNFGGGNTSSKFTRPDPLTGQLVRVLAVKGSGGDLRSIGSSGFALLYLDKLEQLIARYRGEAFEDEMVGFYPLCAFGQNRVAASIDTPLHAFLPFDHVDHLHPDWAIALAASANGGRKLDELNARYGRHIAWVPWQRPGFELGMMLRRAVAEHPECDGILLGSHGLFTWGATQHECYLNSLKTIDQMGEFLEDHARASRRPLFGGASVTTTVDRESVAATVLPHLRGVVSSNRRVVGHFDQSDDAVTFANSHWAAELCQLGTSCPDHFLRTRICPMFVPWDPASEDPARLQQRIDEQIGAYRDEYVAYYQSCAGRESPRLLVMVQGFDFGLDDVVRAKAAHDSMREVAAALGIATGFIRTNVREHPLVRAVAWERTNGGALAAVGHLLAASHSEVLISSSISTRWNEPWGSHLEVDARFSSSRVRFRTVATAHRRMEKIQEVARQTLPRTHLRVCWQNRTATGNCSRCDKCVITRLVLAEAGVLEHFTTFEGPATLPAHLDAIRSDKRIQTLAEMSQSEHLEPAIRRSARGLYERSVRRYSLPVRLRRALVHLWHGWRGTPQR